MRAVQRAPLLGIDPPVGDVVGERVLEGVLDLRERARLVEELGVLQAAEIGRERLFGSAGDGAQHRGTARPCR